MEENHVTVDVNLTDAYGIDRYPFGTDGNVSIKVAKRASVADKPRVTITTNVPFKVTLLWGDSKLDAEVKAGTQTI